MPFFRIVVLLSFMAATSVHAGDGLIVAVASNFQATAREIATEFSRDTEIPVRITSGSTGHLYAQIVNGAPYDIFLAADSERPQLLVNAELADADSLAVYASGYLVLWSRDPAFTLAGCLDDFKAGKFARVAIAKPETAPYGLAAKQVLQAAGLWSAVVDKLVYGENVSQAFQFAATGNAEFGLVAASQVVAYDANPASCAVALDQTYAKHASVQQSGVVLKRSQQPAAARQFMQFMRSPDMTNLLRRRGYR